MDLKPEPPPIFDKTKFSWGELFRFAGIGALLWLASPLLFVFGWLLWQLVQVPFTEKEPDLYYRIEASLQVDGQPLQMEAVVRCHPNVSSPLGGGGSLSYFTWPTIVGKAMPDGSGIFLATGDGGYCYRIWKDHPTQPLEGLPIVLWLPDYVKRDTGELYFLKQHFEAAESHVKLERASMRPATEADYTAWLWRTKPEAPNPYEALGRAYDLGIDAWDQAPQLVCPAAVAIPQSEWETWPGFKEWTEKQTDEVALIPINTFWTHLALVDNRGYPRFASIMNPRYIVSSFSTVDTSRFDTIRPFSPNVETVGSSVYPYIVTETESRYEAVLSSPTNRPRPCAAFAIPDARKQFEIRFGDYRYTLPTWRQGAVSGTVLGDANFFDRRKGVVYITVVSGIWFYAI